MEGQRGERARGHDEELGLVLDQRLDRPEQRNVKLVCGSKIEQLGLAGIERFRQFFDIEAAAKGSDLRRQVLLAERNRLPLKTLARKRKNVTLVGSCKKEYKRFVAAKQPLHLFDRKRLRLCECVIVGEFLMDACGNCVEPPLGLGDLTAQGVNPRPLGPTLR